jgi:hypothetical protein
MLSTRPCTFDVMSTVSISQARRAQASLQKRVGERPEVNGIGIGRRDGGYVLSVNVTRQDAGNTLPNEVEGVPVTVRVRGAIRKRQVA